MAKYNNGINGAFSGKIGTAIGSHWRDIPYIRSVPRRIRKKPTAKQLDVRAKFKPVAGFTHKLSKLLMKYYPQVDKHSGTNQAFSDIYNNALIGSYPDYEIDFKKVCITKGPLVPAEQASATTDGNGMISFNWADNSTGNMANADDKALLIAWCPEKSELRSAIGKTTRSAAGGTLDLVNQLNKEVHLWLAFTTADERVVSTSVYLGMLVVV